MGLSLKKHHFLYCVDQWKYLLQDFQPSVVNGFYKSSCVYHPEESTFFNNKAQKQSSHEKQFDYCCEINKTVDDFVNFQVFNHSF